ncbi:16S rRNA (guanine(966)-N(2))-methyltransferase RsmD [Paracoccus sediminicola]|uniref:16S rRNA (guanine(966)-N(2))-methyltransferase RsmD n=1 Tax=Paracoccus sediminicola TaxID=3017783 RepID=UPI0022F06408|nr:16S rRNA (guanine(966)-N(2))-methyltransferase RsmD [Paracoccus sediminicola]WBU57251.1 16S rRNA (guanine(966)-N(2))-methyltransferase RsmD [Paracoccus sediminicola]
MRIVGGRLRGLKLAEIGAGDISAHLRPTTDRVRETMFNLIVNSLGIGLEGVRVLDLFAGSGALGLEALSRGAARVAFVDDGATARDLLRANVEKARAMGVTDIWRRDATRLGPNRGAGYGLVFMDPPYGQGLGEAALQSALSGGWLSDDALIVWEDNLPPQLPEGFAMLDQRRYGETIVTILRRAA